MFFYLDRRINQEGDLHWQSVDAIADQPILANVLYLQQGRQRLEHFSYDGREVLILGDPVYDEPFSLRRIFSRSGQVQYDQVLQLIKGHYYLFVVQGTDLRVWTSYCGIYPLYYYREHGRVVLCSSSHFIAGQMSDVRTDVEGLVERRLFNYPLFDSTWWEDIRLLPTHHGLTLAPGRWEVRRQYDVTRQFGQPARHGKGALDNLVQCFLVESSRFLPPERSAISFTGGFDGRTLVAAALHARRDFFAYSFGRPGAQDIVIPASQARQIGIDYLPIYLDQAYERNHALNAALRLLELTDHNATLNRPHYHFAAERLGQDTNYMISGNFGSELFRALHQAGAMMSPWLIQVFSSKDDRWKDSLAREVTSWKEEISPSVVDRLIAKLEDYLAEVPASYGNLRFYRFVYEEIFRKYFGPELVMQSYYLNNRTPYLSLNFTQVLNGTIWSGVHSDLFEKAKAKRMKGQLFYAAFIKQACPPLYYLQTGKGYRPADVLETWRWPLLLSGYLRRKYFQTTEQDSNAVRSSFMRYHQAFAARKVNTDHACVQRLLQHAEAQIARGENLDRWLKNYGLAAGLSQQRHAKEIMTEDQ